MKQVLKFFECEKCKESFMCEPSAEKICETCKGIAPQEVGNIHIGSYDRLGDNNFKGASNEWFDLLRKIKKENPNSNIDVK